MHQYSHEDDKPELDGPGGLKMTGGDLTAPQDAGETLDAVNQERGGAQRMEERQQAGEVQQQNRSLRPSSSGLDGSPEPVQGQAVESSEEAQES